MKRFVCFLFILFLTTEAWSKPQQPILPNWFDPHLESKEAVPLLPYQQALEKVPQQVRIPAEYEPAAAVVLGMSHSSEMLQNIARAVAQHTEASVWAVKGPTMISGVPAERYKSLGCAINSIWMRDYGPIGFVQDSSNLWQVGMSDSVYRHYASRRDDDRLPACAAQESGLAYFSAPLILDGGNFMIDTMGNLFMTKRTYQWNDKLSQPEVDEILQTFYKASKIHAIDYAGFPQAPADGTGHIDMFVKLLDDNTVIIAQTQDQPYKSAAEKAVQYFESLEAPDGGGYHIARVPSFSHSGTWYSYTNSLIVNDVVIVPTYARFKNFEATVRSAYENARNGLKVVFVNSDETIRMGGAIHCVTQLVPKLSY